MECSNFAVTVECQISSPTCSYMMEELLGAGSFGEVVQCRKLSSGETVALKVIKDSSKMEDAKDEVHTSYVHMHCGCAKTHCMWLWCCALQERVLIELKEHGSDRFNIVCWNDSFTFQGQFCLEFEKLDMSLHQLLEWRLPLSLMEIRPVLQQV